MNDETRLLLSEAAGRAERLVGLSRIAVAVLLGVLFLAAVLSGHASDPELVAQRHVALWTLLGYLLLGVLTLLRARIGGIPRRAAFALAFVDVAFLLTSTASGLYNMALPLHYAAALPVLWVAPIVLAYGALRYDPLLQTFVLAMLLAGLAVALPLVAPGNAVADLVMLDHLFDGPPNLMRLGMIALAGGLMILASWRTRRLLLEAAEAGRHRLNLQRYLAPQLAERLARTGIEEIRRGRRQHVALLFCDIRGFTRLAEHMAPEELGRFVNEWRRRITVATDRHGGLIDKFLGDGALIVFGLPEAGPADAAAAFACALSIEEEIGNWNVLRRAEGLEPVRIGIGGHAGEVFCGALGDERRLEFTVLGDAVNVAERIQEMTKTHQSSILLSRKLALEAGGGRLPPDVLDLPTQPLRGHRATVEVVGLAMRETTG